MSAVAMAILVPSLYPVFHRFCARGVLGHRVFAPAAWVAVEGGLAAWGVRRERADQTV